MRFLVLLACTSPVWACLWSAGPLTQPQPHSTWSRSPIRLCSCSVTACPLETSKKTKLPHLKCNLVQQFFLFLLPTSCQRFAVDGDRGCSLPLDLRWPLPQAWLLLPCLWLGQHLFPVPCWTPGWHQLQVLCWLPAESLIFVSLLLLQPLKNIYILLPPPFCPASYLPPTPTVSTGASLRPSAWGSGLFTRCNLAQISSCCHAVSVCFPQGGWRMYWCTTAPSALTLTEIPPMIMNSVNSSDVKTF